MKKRQPPLVLSFQQLLRSHSVGSDVARRFIPAAIVLPLGLGWFILQGYQARWYNANFALTLLALSLAIIWLGMIVRSVAILDQLDYDRKRSSDRLRSSEARFQRLATNIPAAVYQYILHPDGTDAFTYISPRAKEIYEYEAAVLMQDFSLIWQMIHPDDVDRVQTINTTSARELAPFDIEFRLLPPSGILRWVQATSQPERLADGSVLWDGIVLDITDQKLLQLNDQFLNNLDLQLRQLPDAAAMTWEAVQSLGKYFQVDRVVWHEIDWVTRTTTIDREWRQGEDVPDITGVYDLEDYFTAEQLEQFTMGQTLVVDDVNIHPTTVPYAQRYLSLGIEACVIVPCVHAGGWVAILSISIKTARKWRSDEVTLLQDTVARLWSVIEHTRAIQALSLQKERTYLATEAAQIGMWFWNLTDNRLEWTNLCKALFGLPPTTNITYEVFLNALHPADRDRTHTAVTRALEEHIEYDIEYRSLWPDGSIHWIAAKGRGFYDATGQPVRMMGTVQEISDRKETEIALQQQTEELIQANRLKDEFLAALSHELRTPLNPILGWTRLLQSQKLTLPETTEALATIDRNVKQQISLVDDLLDVSSVIQGKLLLNLQPIDLAGILRRAIDTVQFAAQAKNITIELQGLASLPTVGDGDRLQQVFWNLLSNAIKFTPKGGRIEVELSMGETQSAQIRVTDTGIGIEPEFLPHVFDHFRQADGSLNRRYGGLGLGLSIVRHLVELHGGTVKAESQKLGEGSTFTITLPLSLQSFSPQSEAPMLPIQNDSEHHSRSNHPSSTAVLNGYRILIVDDEVDNLDLMRFILQQDGASVTTFISAIAALEHIAQTPPDLIISDVGMPEMNGYELMQQIRVLPSGKDIPAIAITAFAQPKDQAEALQAGFQTYFAKPVDPDQLLEAVTQLLTHQPLRKR